jgi:hypothetical protein
MPSVKHKPKIMKGLTIKYDGKEYSNITSLSRGYEHSAFHYVDDLGTEFSVYLQQGKDYEVVEKSE